MAKADNNMCRNLCLIKLIWSFLHAFISQIFIIVFIFSGNH